MTLQATHARLSIIQSSNKSLTMTQRRTSTRADLITGFTVLIERLALALNASQRPLRRA
jgi:hypothetical protein